MDREVARWRVKGWLGAAACMALLHAPSKAANDDDAWMGTVLDAAAAGVSFGVAAAMSGLVVLQAEVRQLEPAFRDAAAPALASWIAESRDAAIREGVQPIPPHIRAELEGYVPADVLDLVRFRVGGGGALSLQQNLFRSGYVPAVTLDHVIVFNRDKDARGDPALWVHELEHVMQYREWGVDGFARRYVHDYDAIENEARAYRRAWHRQELEAR